MKTVLSEVQRFYPEVTEFVDSDEPLKVDVSAADGKSANNKSPKECVMAKAIMRQYNATGAIIRPSVAYVIHGTTATRYNVPGSVSREIVTFDRHHAFQPGEYHLAPMLRSRRSVARRRTYRRNKAKPKAHKRQLAFHHTAGIRHV
jgi:hypothetical protein